MLHKLNIPSCRSHLEWIVQLQQTLLAGLTNPALTPAGVTVAWVIAQWPGLDERWIINFCSRKDEITGLRQPMLAHMRTIAAFPANLKQELLAAFDNDQLFPQAFANPPQAHVLCGLAFLPDDAMGSAVRGLLETFYSPTFYRSIGYRIPQPDNSLIDFDKTAFVERFDGENPNVQVCPYCDGSREGAQVDHFYPKSDYPALSCHPLNLIPICSGCNSTSNKGSKLPLTLGAGSPTAEWLHPYLRPASGTLEVRFETSTEGVVPALFSADPQVQVRLHNLEQLLNLKKRWRSALQRHIQATQNKIRVYFTKAGRALTRDELITKLQDLAANAECEIGLLPFCLIEMHYLQQAAAQIQTAFDELWEYNLSLA